MSERIAFVEAIEKVYIQTSVDFPVAVGELVASADRSWYGSVRSDKDRTVKITPLDSPERLKIGDSLEFLVSPELSQVGKIPFGSIIDPLGRVLQTIHDQSSGKAGLKMPSRSKTFWGLGRLEQAFLLEPGTTILLTGDEAVDPCRFLVKSLQRQHAECIYVVCQGGLRELNRAVKSAIHGDALQRTIFIWMPPWQHAASSAMIAHCLIRLIVGHPGRTSLILFDDLNRWLERLRETGEESSQLLVPHGFLPQTRNLLTHLMELPRTLSGTSMLCGWSHGSSVQGLRSHPFGPLVEHLADTGLCLNGEDERYRLTGDSWGTPLQITISHDMLEKQVAQCDDERKPWMDLLQDLIDRFYYEVDPDRLDDESPITWGEKEHLSLKKIIETTSGSILEELTILQNRMKLASLESFSKPREVFGHWLNSCDEEVRP